jgi:hypothetical protein
MEAQLPQLRGRTALSFVWDVTDPHMDAPSTWKSLVRSITSSTLFSGPGSPHATEMLGGSLRKTEFGEKPRLTLVIEEE